VARLHNASIDLEGNDPGLRARIVIPMAGEAVRR
jgi:hypothetical protein